MAMMMNQRFPRFGAPPFRDAIEEDAMREDPFWNRGFVDAPDAPPRMPPPMPSMKRDSMVGIEDEPAPVRNVPGPEMVPGMVGVSQSQLRIPTPPPQSNATDAPPENPVRRYQRELEALKEPERGPVSKWAKLAAIGLGAAQGYYNAANPNARPIDNSEAIQTLTTGPKYIAAMRDYQRQRKDIGDRMKLAGDAEQVETNKTYRESMAANSRRDDEAAADAKKAKDATVLAGLSEKGYKLIGVDEPLPEGYEESPGFEKNGKRMVRNPRFDETQLSADQSKLFPGTSPGQWVKKKTLESALLKPAVTGGQIRNMNQSVSVTDALANVASGVGVYYKPDGTEWAVPELQALQGNHQGLQGVLRGNQVMYIPFTPHQRAVTFDNQVVAVTPFTVRDAAKTGDTGNVVLGQARTGQTVSNTPTTVEFDKAGVPHVLGSTSQTTPNTPAGRTPPQDRPVSNAPPHAALPQSRTSAPPPVATPLRVGGSGPQARMAQGVTPGMHKDFMARAVPVRSVATQIFGDPTNPDAIPSMRKFAYLADDEGSRTRIGNAFRILLANDDHLAIGNQSDTSGWATGGNVGSGALVPLSVGVNGSRSGSGSQSAPTLSPEQAAKINAQIASVVNQLKPGDERMALISGMKAYEEIGGLRKAFGGGNSLTFLKTMQQTLPMMGFNDTNSSEVYHSKLTRTAEDAANGAWGIPANYLGPDVVEAIERERRYVPALSTGGGRGGGSAAPPIEQQSPSTKAYRHSLDGGKTWLPGRAPR